MSAPPAAPPQPALPMPPSSAQQVVDAALAPEIPAPLLEGAASRARLKAMAALLDPGAQLTDAAADLIDNLLGRLVEDATVFASEVARTRAEVTAKPGAPPAPPVLAASDVAAYANDVWGRLLAMPNVDLIEQMVAQNPSAGKALAALPPAAAVVGPGGHAGMGGAAPRPAAPAAAASRGASGVGGSGPTPVLVRAGSAGNVAVGAPGAGAGPGGPGSAGPGAIPPRPRLVTPAQAAANAAGRKSTGGPGTIGAHPGAPRPPQR